MSTKILAVRMAYDAFRICMGWEPGNYSPEEVQRWMALMLKEANKGDPERAKYLFMLYRRAER